VYTKLGILSTESFMKEKEVPQRAVVRVRRARPRSFLFLGKPGGATLGVPLKGLLGNLLYLKTLYGLV